MTPPGGWEVFFVPAIALALLALVVGVKVFQSMKRGYRDGTRDENGG